MLAAVAGDGFEAGNFSGGTGQWQTGGWTVAGDASLQASGQHTGSYHARLRAGTGDLQRSVDVSGLSDVKLQFWSKVSSFEGSDQARVQVSGNGSSWTTLQTFAKGQSDDQYHFHQLAVPNLGSTLYVRFDAAMNATNDNWYLDDIAITAAPTTPPTFSFPDFSDPSGLNLVGAASITANNRLRLTPAVGGVNGAAWYATEKQFAAVAWETRFDFALTENVHSPGGSDGFTFIIQNHDPTFLAGGGGSLGYNNLFNSIAVEFDTFQNSEANDPSHSHISVHTNGTGPNGWLEALSLGSYSTPNLLDDAATHSVKVSYVPGSLSVFLDDLVNPVLTVPVDVNETLDLDGGRAWLGFTAATGGGWQNHDILNWEHRVLADTTTTVAVENASLLEGDSGMSELVFTVIRMGDTSGVTTVEWSTQNVTAIAGSDYAASSGVISFPDGDATPETVTVSVPIFGDTVEEAHETLRLVLANLQGGTLVAPSAIGTIMNDDTSLSIDDITVTEGDMTVRYSDDFVSAGSGGVASPRGIAFGLDGHLYVSSSDTDSVLRYDGATGTFLDVFVAPSAGGLKFPRGLAFHNGDLYVASSSTNSVLRYDGATGTFVGEFVAAGSGGLTAPRGLFFGNSNDLYVTSTGAYDAVLRYDATTGAFVDEFIGSGNGLDNPTRLTMGADGNFYVSSTGPTSNAILRYGSNGAFLGTFVTSGSGGLNAPADLMFSAGKLLVAGAQSHAIHAYHATTGQYLGDYIAPGTGGLERPNSLAIDASGSLFISSVTTNRVLRFNTTDSIPITVRLSRPSAQIVTVDFATLDGSALAEVDYVGASGTITFAPGETSRTVLIPAVDDAELEGDETFNVVLSNVVGAVIADASAVVTIVDDDAPPATETVLFADSFEVGEWNGLWVEDSQNDWFRSNQRATAGTRSAEVDGSASNATLTTAASFNLTGYTSATLTFSWYIESGLDAGEFLALDISTNGGATWQNDVRRLRGNVDAENVWHNETVDLTPYLSGDLRFRFRATMSGSDEDANVDNVRLVAIAPAPAAATTGVGTVSLFGWSEEEENETSILPDILLPA